jgi:hypothetical protein
MLKYIRRAALSCPNDLSIVRSYLRILEKTKTEFSEIKCNINKLLFGRVINKVAQIRLNITFFF